MTSPSPQNGTRSPWMDTAPSIVFDPLDGDTTVDVCVIGAGIAGLTAGYLLQRDGLTVAVLDDGPVGGGETQRTTAHLSCALGTRYADLEKEHGKDGALLIAQSHTEAIRMIEDIARTEDIDCEFERLEGYLFLGPETDKSELQKERDAGDRAGLRLQLLDNTPAPGLRDIPSLRFPEQAQFHVLRYLRGLADALRKRGGQVHTGTHAAEVQGGDKAYVKTSDGHTVHCNHIVIATNAPVHDSLAIYTRQAPYRTYAMGLRVVKGRIPKALYWDTQDPYHYIRLAPGKDPDDEVLIVGGEDHKTGQQNDAGLRFTRLEKWARDKFPEAGEVLYRWSGQVMETIDGIAFIGHNPLDKRNVHIITGDCGNGMTHGTLGAQLVADLIQGRPNDWEKVYNPSRIRLTSLGEFAKEGLNTAAQYTELLQKSSPNDALEPGSGRVVQDGIHKVALYKDPDGKEHRMSAVCPHKGCIVHWNSLEKSWDCPCHGSRFDCDGTVLNGPSIADLKRL